MDGWMDGWMELRSGCYYSYDLVFQICLDPGKCDIINEWQI